jgi:hypothetical protein
MRRRSGLAVLFLFLAAAGCGSGEKSITAPEGPGQLAIDQTIPCPSGPVTVPIYVDGKLAGQVDIPGGVVLWLPAGYHEVRGFSPTNGVGIPITIHEGDYYTWMNMIGCAPIS